LSVTTSYPKDLLRDLLDGKLSPERIREIQRAPKDPDRFAKIVAIEQERVAWPERILVCLQEHLYVVDKQGERIVRCSCGHEFGDYRTNWKEAALVYERDPQDGEVYARTRAADPEFMVLREFYCPGCATQLEVEAVPPGYPFIFSFLPDLGP
jgi:acetone carboxylase gamma subunit